LLADLLEFQTKGRSSLFYATHFIA
jgi:hypothetical protein